MPIHSVVFIKTSFRLSFELFEHLKYYFIKNTSKRYNYRDLLRIVTAIQMTLEHVLAQRYNEINMVDGITNNRDGITNTLKIH